MDLATVDELLTTTRSIRRRLDLTRPVARSVIQQCLEIATQAPTGGDTARYHFDDITQVALLPVAHITGSGLRPAHRVPARDRTYWDTWGQIG